MFFRKALSTAQRLSSNMRLFSSHNALVDIAVDNDGISIMTMQRPPVNSLNLDLLKELSKSLDEVAKNKSKGLILTSALPTVFSAGLDIMEMYKPDLKRAEEFWTTLQDVWFKLFGSSLITTAAINGHAFAGGCALAISCEYRVQVEKRYKIGLNEAALGVVAPTWIMDTFCRIIPVREVEYALTTAKMFTSDEAFKVGLIDEIVSDKVAAICKCKEFINKLDKIPPHARSSTKLKMREEVIKRFHANRKADVKEFIALVSNPKTQQNIEIYVQELKKKTTKKNFN